MAFLEMARNPRHGGKDWAFTKCVWSPSRKKDGRAWPFWKKILDIQEGDLVLHLRGVSPEAAFVGYSIADSSGYTTDKRPPEPGEWGFAEQYFKAELRNFSPFASPVLLRDIFVQKRGSLEQYYERNRLRGRHRLNLFYVPQAGRLQCQNGAYMSDLDDELFGILFSEAFDTAQKTLPVSDTQVATDTQLAAVRQRIGQQTFSRQVKELYDFKCCFPGCGVDDPRFLIGAHIARWSDNEALRGELANGLCLCVLHDKAFEIGMFTIDENHRVFLNPDLCASTSQLVCELQCGNGESIRASTIPPSHSALSEHWDRVGVNPSGQTGSRPKWVRDIK